METKEQVLGIIRNQINEIDDTLDNVKLQFADSCLDENDWQCRNDKKVQCKMYQAQVEILEKMENIIEEIMPSIPRESVA